jgi:FkbM family methyltransferase
MRLLDQFKKPEYILRPRQILIRVRRTWGRANRFEQVALPWGSKIKIEPAELVGRSIWTVGVGDLPVSEALWRLTDRGETAIDIGANIGYMTGLLAFRVGRQGRVLAFEPHPRLVNVLTENVDAWRCEIGATIEVHPLALSDHEGEALLGIPDDFDQNHGLAYLVSAGDDGPRTRIPVQIKCLDNIIKEKIGILKIDIEGHELSALKGAAALIDKCYLRDIVFEEHREYPTPVTRFLEERGYALFDLSASLLGPKISWIGKKPQHRRWETRSCLATLNPSRALRRFERRGWHCLRSKSYHLRVDAKQSTGDNSAVDPAGED